MKALADNMKSLMPLGVKSSIDSALVFLALSFSAFLLTKTIYLSSGRPIIEFINGLASPNQDRAFWMAVLCLVWGVYFAFFEWIKKRLPDVFGPSILFSSIGAGIVLVLAAGQVGVTGIFIERILLWGPFVLINILCLFGALYQGSVVFEEATGEKFNLGKFLKVSMTVLAVLACGTMALRILEAWNELSWLRGPAVGDEAYFWWTSTEALSRLDLSTYMRAMPSSSYYPAYPFIGIFLTNWLPKDVTHSALHFVPLFYGGILIYSWISAAAIKSKLLMLGVAVVPVALLVYHDWVFAMFFKLWYGEALAVLIIFWLFQLIESEQKLSFFRSFQLFGLGALAVLSKPPLASLAIPVVIPTYFFLTWYWKGNSSPVHTSLRFLAVWAGSLVAGAVWKAHLASFNKTIFYSFDFKKFLEMNLLEGSFPLLVDYFFRSYKPYWAILLLLGGIAIIRDFRKNVSPLMISLGLALSVFVLYATQWKSYGDYESGARYILHGFVAWSLFYSGRLFGTLKA